MSNQLPQATDATQRLPRVAATRLGSTDPPVEDNSPDLQWSTENLKEAQELDPDIGPVLRWHQTDDTRPPWETVAPYSEDTKLYWAQWDSFCVRGGVLYRVWE